MLLFKFGIVFMKCEIVFVVFFFYYAPELLFLYLMLNEEQFTLFFDFFYRGCY